MTVADLYDEYEQLLRAYALKLGRDPHLADDLVQDTLIRSMGHLPLLDQLDSRQRRAWLYQTLKNLYLDRRSARQREQALLARLQTYGASTRFIMGKLTLDEDYLDSLDDATELLVIGKVDAPDILDDDLLKRKLARLEVTGKISCRGENQTALRAILDDKGATRISAVPTGFTPIDGSIVLDGTTLPALPGRKLACAGSVRIAADVSPDSLDQAVDELRVAGLLICPAALKEAVVRKCDMLKTKAVFHPGELWLIDDRTELAASRFDYLDGKATLVVRDTLAIDPAIDPKLLADRLDKVHNQDTIRCTPEQMGALQARMGLDEGKLVDVTQKKEEKPEEEGIGNVGTLKL